MRMKRALPALLGLAAAALVPVIVKAPQAVPSLPQDVRTIEEAVTNCRASGLQGWELVDHATHLVNSKFTRYSCWHLWETPERAFRNSRGFSDQYNTALALVLVGLGFEVEIVHAARVRPSREPSDNPWWNAGKTWLRVSHDGRTLEVSAGDVRNQPGDVCFIPESEARLVNPWTLLDIRLAMTPLVTARIWQSWLRQEPVPRWIYSEFNHDSPRQEGR